MKIRVKLADGVLLESYCENVQVIGGGYVPGKEQLIVTYNIKGSTRLKQMKCFKVEIQED